MYVYVVVVVVVHKEWQWWVITQATCTVWWCFLSDGGIRMLM